MIIDQRATIPAPVDRVWAIKLEPAGEGATDLAIHTETTIAGKLGEFGQAVIRKKADQMIADFARNVSAEVSKPR